MLSRLNPFKGLPNPREVWAWGMFDLANQSFAILINTLFFPIYFASVIVGDDTKGKWLWGLAAGGANLLVVVCAPIVGAFADSTGSKKRVLFVTWLGCVASLVLLSFAGPGMVAYAMIFFACATVCYSAGENLVASFLPDIADARRMARVSALGWTMGYAGALLVLPVALVITGTEASASENRTLVLLAAVWFFANALPTFLFVHEKRIAPTPGSHANPLTVGFVRFGRTIRDASQFRQVFRFLPAFLVYSCGVQVVIYFSGIIATDDFGFTGVKLLLFFLQITVTAGIGAFGIGKLQDALGRKRALTLTLGVWIVASVGAALLPRTPEFEWAFWLIGNLIGLALGAIGAGSRAFFGVLTPLHKSAEFFGLWGASYKLAAVIGPPLYGLAVALFSGGPEKPSSDFGSRAALLVVAGFFTAGLIGLSFVNEGQGRRDARRSDREAGARAADARDLAAAQSVAGSESPPIS
jgi:UMF1 family MFS transporter